MAPNSLSPASLVISGHSAYGAHKATFCTKEWFPTDITGALGSYQNWSGVAIDAETMVRDLLGKLKVFMLPSFSWDEVTAYTQADADAPNIPQKSVLLGIAGTSTSTNPSAAVSATFNFVTTGNGKVKIVLLDSPFGSNWLAPLLPADFDSAVGDVIIQFCSPGNAWSGRDDLKPQTLRKITYDINDKLQKMYFGN